MAKKTCFSRKARQIMRRWRNAAFCVKSLFRTLFVRLPPIEKHAGRALERTWYRCAAAFFRIKKFVCFPRRHHGNERRMNRSTHGTAA
ncbi:hypothetical protein ISCGN_005873 [Ixodes scapularis]